MKIPPAWFGACVGGLVVVAAIVAVFAGLAIAAARRDERVGPYAAPLWPQYAWPAGLLAGVLLAGAVAGWLVSL